MFESASETDATFIARNDGRSGGVLRVEYFSLDAVQSDISKKSIMTAQLFHDGSFVEAGKEQKVVISVDKNMEKFTCSVLTDSGFFKPFGSVDWTKEKEGSARIDGRYGKMSASLSCNFSAAETSFHSDTGASHRKETSTPCRAVRWVDHCLIRANTLFFE